MSTPVDGQGQSEAVLSQLSSALARYAEDFHAQIQDGHHVASPLGAWLLLALVGLAARGPEQSALEKIIGMDADAAAAAADRLVSHPHPLVLASLAAWHRPAVESDEVQDWLAALPVEVERGNVPSRDDADTWVRERTLGLIDRLPLENLEQVLLALVSALATKVAWDIPFEECPGSELGPASAWSSQLNLVLRTPEHRSSASRMFLARTERAGLVAVHEAVGRADQFGLCGVSVYSVIAEPGIGRRDVLAAAYDVATTATRDRRAPRSSLFDLPLGERPAWTISEVIDEFAHGRERYSAVLPAWSARSQYDLLKGKFGFDVASQIVRRVLPPQLSGIGWFEASQSAVARYHRLGFEAAAITSFAYLLSRAGGAGPCRVAAMRFGHPYAVVAVATDMHDDAGHGELRRGPWHGVPVFSAWVSEPEEATLDEATAPG